MKLVRFGFLVGLFGVLWGCQTTSNSEVSRTTGEPALPGEQQLLSMATNAYKADQYRDPIKIEVLSLKQEQVYFSGKQWIVCLSTQEKAYHSKQNENGGIEALQTYDFVSKTWAMDLNHNSRDGWYVGIFRMNGEPFGSKNVSDLCGVST